MMDLVGLRNTNSPRLSLSAKPTKKLAVSLDYLLFGYGHFFPGDYIKSSVRQVPANGGAVGADWFYVQAAFNF